MIVLPWLGRYLDQGATFDEPARRYRYRLWRRWGTGTTILWIMLNPSTADEDVLDPTLRRCEDFSRRFGYAGFDVVNLFAWRSTDPARLSQVASPIGEEKGATNDVAIRRAGADSSSIICGWGREKIARIRAIEVERMLHHRQLGCLGLNKDASPRHPLYLKSDTPIHVYREPRMCAGGK